MRVPSERFDDVLARLREIATEVRSVTTGSSDVTEEYTDIEATLTNLRAVELQYTELLGRASTIGDVLQVQDRLNQVRLQIDRTEARRQSLASQVAMSTIHVSLRPPAVPAGGEGALALAADAWLASWDTLAWIGTTLIVSVAYAWWLLVPAIVAAVVLLRRRGSAPSAQPSAVAAPDAEEQS